MANYRALSRKTKHELQLIAEDLDVSKKEFKVKKDYYNAIQAYFDENRDSFPENHKYYEVSHPGRISQASSPVKRTRAPVKEESDEEDSDDDDDDEDEIEQEVEAAAIDDNDEDEVIVGEVVVTESDDDNKPSLFAAWLDKLRPSSLDVTEAENFIEETNMQVREILSDPYNINDIVAVFEVLILAYSLTKSTTVSTYVPASIEEHVPQQVLDFTVLDYKTFDSNFFAITLLWSLTSYLIPHVISFYINFTYDFEYDAFIFGLVKVLVGLVLFKTDIPSKDAVKELVYQFSAKSFSLSYALLAFKHYSLYATVYLRELFGNWILIGALFSSVIAFYANLTFI